MLSRTKTNRSRRGETSVSVNCELTPCDRPDNQKWFPARHDCFGQWRIRRVVRQIFLASEESQERAPLFRDMIADRSLQHRIRRLDRIENRPLRHRTLHLNLDLVSDLRQSTKMLRKLNANRHCHLKSTFISRMSLAYRALSIHSHHESRPPRRRSLPLSFRPRICPHTALHR